MFGLVKVLAEIPAELLDITDRGQVDDVGKSDSPIFRQVFPDRTTREASDEGADAFVLRTRAQPPTDVIPHYHVETSSSHC